jgi:outer membrane protein OmpA-like peptidoglycan-associated protein
MAVLKKMLGSGRAGAPLLRAAIGCGLLGCGTAAAPQELHNARHAYTQASQGAAAQLAPAQLDTARQAVERANMAFGSGDDEEAVRDLAYVAERQVAIAVSSAGLEQANRSLAKYEKDEQELRRKLQNATQNELARIKKELENEHKARLVAERSAEAALKSLDEVARVKEESRGIVITLSGSVLFATGEHSLLPIAKDKLREVAQVLIEQGDSTIVVEGHTDARGSSNKNHELSLLRAQEVRGYLVSQGIPTSSIQAQGLGEERPVATNDTAEGRANNRRVEIVVNPKNKSKARAESAAGG